jgi:hypothetical protein
MRISQSGFNVRKETIWTKMEIMVHKQETAERAKEEQDD